MRSGNLDTPADLLMLSADLLPFRLDWIWCGIQTKETAELPFPSGLRSPAKIAIRAWWDARIQQDATCPPMAACSTSTVPATSPAAGPSWRSPRPS